MTIVLPTVLVLLLVGSAAGAGWAWWSDGDSRVVHDHRSHGHKEKRPAASVHIPSSRLSDVPCTDGTAGPFPCDGIDLLSFVPRSEFGGPSSTFDPLGGVSDIWGWVDPQNGDEYVIVGDTDGVAFYRVTDPTNPVYLGDLVNTAAAQLIWHDVKVFEDHAFVVSESQPHGLRVFDLTRLRGVTDPQAWMEDQRYPLNVAAHNIAIDEESGFAYIVGGNVGLVVSDACSGGLHIVDVNDPLTPKFAGCFEGSGYIHDTQCVVYRGPDEGYFGRELCFNSAEDHLSIVDVTEKDHPVLVATALYPSTAYTHQGWLTEDQAHFLLGDELDERDHGSNTRTVIVDVTDLDAPSLDGQHVHSTAATDHNMFVKGQYVYQSNYAAGLRVLSTADVSQGELDEVAYFDTYPAHDAEGFVGSWGNYPYLPSGTIAVTGMDEGLFLVKVRDGVL